MVMTTTQTLASFRPPAPVPRSQAHGAIGLLKALWENPLEAWTQAHFEAPVVSADLLLGRAAVISDPRAIRRVLVENSGNYRKDSLQQRILAGGLGKGLLAVEGDQWRLQRRTLAPMFS